MAKVNIGITFNPQTLEKLKALARAKNKSTGNYIREILTQPPETFVEQKLAREAPKTPFLFLVEESEKILWQKLAADNTVSLSKFVSSVVAAAIYDMPHPSTQILAKGELTQAYAAVVTSVKTFIPKQDEALHDAARLVETLDAVLRKSNNPCQTTAITNALNKAITQLQAFQGETNV